MALYVEPLGSFVLIKRIDEDSEMKHGLHIPQIAQVKSSKGRVVGVGEGRMIDGKLEPLPVKENDIVMFSKYGGTEVELDGEEYILVRFDELYLKQRLVALARVV